MKIVPLYEWAMSVKGTTATSDIADFGSAVQDIVDSYLSGARTLASARAEFTRIVDNTMSDLIEQAWADGGRSLDDLSTDYVVGILGAQRDFARAAFDTLAEQVKTAKDAGQDIAELAQGFGDRWAGGAWGVYNETVMRTKAGTRKTLYTWVLGATEKHCGTCSELAAGPSHSMDWFLARDYIPGKNGAAMECGGWRCDCQIIEADGTDLTLTADTED